MSEADSFDHGTPGSVTNDEMNRPTRPIITHPIAIAAMALLLVWQAVWLIQLGALMVAVSLLMTSKVIGISLAVRKQLQTDSGQAGCAEDSPDDLKTVVIQMPEWMLDDLRQRAEQRGVTVTELIRRAVAFERRVFDRPDNLVAVRRVDGSGFWVERYR